MNRRPTFTDSELLRHIARATGTRRHSTPQKLAGYLRAHSPELVGVCVFAVALLATYLVAGYFAGV